MDTPFSYLFSAPVTALAGSVEPDFVVAAVNEFTHVLSMEKGKLVVVQVLKGHSKRINSVCRYNEGIMIASSDACISYSDISPKRQDRSTVPVGWSRLILGGHTTNVKTICPSPNGRLICSGACDAKIKIWDPSLYLSENPRPQSTFDDSIATLTYHTDTVNSCLWNDDNLISASEDCSVVVWDKNYYQRKNTMLFKKPVRCADVFGSNVVALAFGGKKGMLSIQDIRMAAVPLRQGNLKSDRPIMNLKYHSSGNYILTGGGNALLWDVRSLEKPVIILEAKNGVNCVDWWMNERVLSGCSTSLSVIQTQIS